MSLRAGDISFCYQKELPSQHQPPATSQHPKPHPSGKPASSRSKQQTKSSPRYSTSKISPSTHTSQHRHPSALYLSATQTTSLISRMFRAANCSLKKLRHQTGGEWMSDVCRNGGRRESFVVPCRGFSRFLCMTLACTGSGLRSYGRDYDKIRSSFVLTPRDMISLANMVLTGFLKKTDTSEWGSAKLRHAGFAHQTPLPRLEPSSV